ncbi:MAG: CCA tRNA nucleotidyltransferase [Deltaproteobacteria bacterium]|nr:CCA tRNA nucleotidyltransferase [Candidatus Anaeroferrophillacea bacterium]
MPAPRIIPRAHHPISRKEIDRNALKILYRLKDHGHTAYLVGGAVRDLLLGRRPADFDIATDASPQQIKKLFRNSRIIGRRFRLAHIFFRDPKSGAQQIIEVATFRREMELTAENQELLEERPTLANNIYGTPAEDVRRRDFTINALFYTVDGFKVIDHLGGLDDLEDGIVRIIGDPYIRCAEDPVRILRALEFVARLNFVLDPETAAAIRFSAPELAGVAPSRLREELRGLYTKGATAGLVRLAAGNGILEHWLPALPPEHAEDTARLLDGIETVIGHEADEQLLEVLVIAAILLPELFHRFGGGQSPGLGVLQEKIDARLLEINHRLTLPKLQRHRITDILLGVFRLIHGDKRVKRLRRRGDFPLWLFLLRQLTKRYPESLAKVTDFWLHQAERWQPATELPTPPVPWKQLLELELGDEDSER